MQQKQTRIIDGSAGNIEKAITDLVSFQQRYSPLFTTWENTAAEFPAWADLVQRIRTEFRGVAGTQIAKAGAKIAKAATQIQELATKSSSGDYFSSHLSYELLLTLLLCGTLGTQTQRFATVVDVSFTKGNLRFRPTHSSLHHHRSDFNLVVRKHNRTFVGHVRH